MHFSLLVVLLFPLVNASSPTCLGVQRSIIKSNEKGYLFIEILNDSLIHFEHSLNRLVPDPSLPMYKTQMVDPDASYCGPSYFNQKDQLSYETKLMLVTVSQPDLQVLVYDKIAKKTMTTFAPFDKQLQWTKEETKAVYGIAAAFGVECKISVYSKAS